MVGAYLSDEKKARIFVFILDAERLPERILLVLQEISHETLFQITKVFLVEFGRPQKPQISFSNVK